MNRFAFMAVYGLLLLITQHMHLMLHPLAGLTVSIPAQVLLAAPVVLSFAVVLPLTVRSVLGHPLFRPGVAG